MRLHSHSTHYKGVVTEAQKLSGSLKNTRCGLEPSVPKARQVLVGCLADTYSYLVAKELLVF